MDKEQARKLYELTDRLSKLDVNTLSEEQLAERTAMIARLQEVKQRLDPKCWKGKHKEGTKIKGGVRVNNCVPNESLEQNIEEAELDEKWSQKYKDSINCSNPKGFSQKAHCASKNESIEEANGEYDDEAGMAQSNLRTMARAVNGLLDTIEDNDNLPEWAQEKIAKAEMMVTSVWDYLLSQKEQGVDPKVESIVELYQIDEAVLNEIDPGLITNLVAVFPTISKIIVSNALSKAAAEKQETEQMIDVLKKKANGEQVTPEETEAMKTQFKDLIGYGLTAVGSALTGGALAGIASVYKKEIFELIKSKGPEVLINLLKSKGNMDVVKILSSKFLSKHALPFYTAPKVQESKKPSPKLTPVNIKKTEAVSEEINTEAYERLQKVFAFKNYES